MICDKNWFRKSVGCGRKRNCPAVVKKPRRHEIFAGRPTKPIPHGFSETPPEILFTFVSLWMDSKQVLMTKVSRKWGNIKNERGKMTTFYGTTLSTQNLYKEKLDYLSSFRGFSRAWSKCRPWRSKADRGDCQTVQRKKTKTVSLDHSSVRFFWLT